MKTIVHLIGNRPQFIKLGVLYNELKKTFNQKIIHSGQHYSYAMSDIFFEQLNIPAADINLNIQHHNPDIFIGKVAEGLSDYFKQNPESVAFVYGDTNTTLAAAIAAKRNNIPLIHFEAGVRTGEMNMPEEINRILTDRLADVNYCCTKKNLLNLEDEGYGKSINCQALLTGDLMLDAFLKTGISEKNITDKNNYVACTIHRSANLSDKKNLGNIIAALNEINHSIPVIFPLHPHTEKKLKEYGLKPSFELIEPLGYLEMKRFLKDSSVVITDSGGVCREAYFFKKKSLIIMETPFWPEIIEEGCSLNTCADKHLIINSFEQLKSLKADFSHQIFGNGQASKLIAEHLSEYLRGS